MISYLYPPTPVSVTIPPLEYVRNGVSTQVAEDTANAANNRGLPILPTFYRNGVPVTVNIDTVTPANNRGLPVEIANVSGSVTINAGDLSVSTVSTNDSMAIGDPVTGLLANVTTSGSTGLEELHVTDDDGNTFLAAIDASLNQIDTATQTPGSAIAARIMQVGGSDGANARALRTDANGELQIDVLSSALPSGAASLAEQQTQTTALGAIQTAVQLLDNSANVDGNPAGTAGLMIGGIDGVGNFQQVSVNTAGELSVTFGSAGFSTETTLAALNAKVANNYGAASGAVRAAAQVGNAGGAADFNAGATGAQTLRVAANLQREGNALAYNVGSADANTLRAAALLTDGTSVLPFGTLGASRFSAASIASLLPQLGVMIGWDGTNHREVSITTAGHIEVEQASKDGALTQIQRTVGVTAVRATVSGGAPSNTRKLLMVKPSKNNTGAIYIGSSSVTTANGLEIIGPDRLEFIDDHSDYYLISDTAGQIVEILERA
jgi:hypothetical protein